VVFAAVREREIWETIAKGTSVDGCTSVDSVLIAVNPCVGLNRGSTAGHLTLFPNPADTHVTLKLSGNDGEIHEVNVMYALGRSEAVVVTRASTSSRTLTCMESRQEPIHLSSG